MNQKREEFEIESEREKEEMKVNEWELFRNHRERGSFDGDRRNSRETMIMTNVLKKRRSPSV